LKKLNIISFVALISVMGMGTSLVFAAGPTPINLGSATNFAVLAGSTITNTGSSVVNGDLGLSPGSAVTGFPPGTLNGTQHVADATTVQAKTDLTNAFNNAAGQSPVSQIGTQLGGTTQNPGIYNSADGTFGITGTLTLDAHGDANAVFIFKTASTLITAGSSNVSLVNGAQACNVFWQVGSSATFGTNSTFKGNILALTSATLTTGAHVEGRILAQNAAVTLDSVTITKPSCTVASAVVTPVVTPVVTATTTTVVTATTTPVIAPRSTTTAPVIAPVAIPIFPHTGFAPENTTARNIIAVLGLGIVLAAVYVIRRKRAI
jgi:hypothetical protein